MKGELTMGDNMGHGHMRWRNRQDKTKFFEEN